MSANLHIKIYCANFYWIKESRNVKGFVYIMMNNEDSS